MGKQQSTPSRFTPAQTGVGISDELGTNPVFQRNNAIGQTIDQGLDNRPEATDALNNVFGNQDKSEYDYAISKGAQFNNNPTDQEHTLAATQPFLFGNPMHSDVGRALLKFVPMVATKFVDQVQNMISGTAKILGAEDFAKFTSSPDNAINEYVDDVATELKAALPQHASAKYDSDNLGAHLLSSKFWTDDIADGTEFVMAMALGAKGAAGLTEGLAKGAGALSKATNLGELYQSIPITERIATATANNFTTKTVGFLNAASISAMQAKGTANQIQAKLREKYTNTVDPETGMLYAPDKVEQKIKESQDLIDEKTNNTFWATMATELAPSIWASKLFLGRGKESMGLLNEDIKKAVNEGKLTLEDIKNGTNTDVLKKTGFLDTKEISKAALVGGPVAMNLQQSIQQYDVDQAVGGKGGNAWDSKYGYVKQFLDNFTQKEGIKSIILGSILGAGTATVHGFGANGQYNEAMEGHLKAMQAADGLYGGVYAEAMKGIYQTDPAGKLKLNEDGQPVEDIAKIQKLVFGMLQHKELWDSQTAAVLAGNSDMASLNEKVALSQAIASELQSGRYENTDQARQFLKWFHTQRIREQGKVAEKEAQDNQVADSAAQQAPDPEQGQEASVKTQTAISTGTAKGDANISRAVNDNSMLLDKLFDMWDKTGRQAAKLTKIGDNPSRTAFNESVRRTLFYEAAKREALLDMIADRKKQSAEPGADMDQLMAESQVLDKLHQDSLDRSSQLANKPDEVFKHWDKFNSSRHELTNDLFESKAALEKENTKENNQKTNTAAYRLAEFNAKEGIGYPTQTDPSTGDVNWVKGDELNNGTNLFAINQNPLDRQAVPIGMRNDAQFKAGAQYKDMLQLQSMIDSAREGKTPLAEVVAYAHDKIDNLDSNTKAKLQDLIDQQSKQLTEDKQKLAATPEVIEDEEGYPDPNPEYADLSKQVQQREQAIQTSTDLLAKKANDTELDRLQRSPEKQEEYLNRRFAETHFDKAENVLQNAIDNGRVKDTYADSRAVARAIQDVTFMRDAMEDRMKNGDLKGQDGYAYLITKADEILARLAQVQQAVAENQVKRDAIQSYIGQQHAGQIASALGFNLETNSITDPATFNIADGILGGKLQDMFSQIRNLASGNFYEGSQALLHTIKTKATETDKVALLSSLEDKVSAAVAALPEPRSSKHLKTNFGEAPEIYLVPLLRSMTEGQTELNEGKYSPINLFRQNNDLAAFEDSINALPAGDTSLGVTKEKLQAVLKSYREIVSAKQVSHLLGSGLNLETTVGKEIENATGAIVPTTQQEIAIRDGLAWLKADKEVTTGPFAGWGFLRGIAGTGKTSVAMKWLIGLSGLKPEEIISSAATAKAAGVLGSHLGTESVTIDELMDREIPAGKKLIIVDEYARVSSDKLKDFQNKVQVHNKNLSPADRLKVMILGDPTQITPEVFRNQDITDPSSNPDAKRIRVINPLTVVYRSDVSAVTQTSDIFQDNPEEVRSINVRASGDEYTPHAVGTHTGKTAQGILDAIKVNQAAEDPNGLGYTPRTRVIITDTPAKLFFYGSSGVPVISVYDAQSETYDEVYVDLDPKNFYDTEKYNAAMYTAASRAQEYSYIKYADGKNTIDQSLIYEKETNDRKGAEAKGDYIKARTEEQQLMQQGVTGQPLEVTPVTKAEQVANESPLDKATDPEVPEEQEIVAETPSVPDEQTLPGDMEPEGDTQPDTETPAPPVADINPTTVLPSEHILPNIESAAFPALKLDENGQSNIGVNSQVYYFHTRENNGQDSVTVMAMGKDGTYVPISKIFQEEIQKFPQYGWIKEGIKTSTPISGADAINPKGAKAGKLPEELKNSILRKGQISAAQRLTYQYGNQPVEGTGVLKHISDLFKSKFYHSNPDQQAKGDKVHYKIFRKNEVAASKAKGARYQFGGFTPDPGIPYAVIGVEPGATDYRNAQFVRLTANRLDQESEHYTTLKKYRDTATELQRQTGIDHGSSAYSKLVKALKNSLEIVHEDTATGTEPKVRVKENYTREDLESALNKVNEDDRSSMPPELEDLLDPSNAAKLASVLPHAQSLAMQLYGVRESAALMNKEEADKYPDYEHIPAKGEEETGLGRVLLKGTGGNTGRKAVYKKAYELQAGKGPAQKAFDQLAKTNEFAGNIRIRVEDIAAQRASKGRVAVSTGKSLMTDAGGNTAISRARPLLAQILGESKVASGELEEADLDRADIKAQLSREVRQLSSDNGTGILDTGKKILDQSGIDPDTKSEYLGKLARLETLKETSPVTLDTLNMIVGDQNFDDAGRHLTQQEFNVQGRNGRTKTTRTYMRKPLDIDQFNTLGKDPKANADTLATMVGTKLQDIHPTVISVSHEGIETPSGSGRAEEVKVPATTPGSEVELQKKITDLQDRIATAKGKEKIELLKEMKQLREDRYGSAKLFDSSQRGKDTGQLITIDKAREMISQMLPGMKPEEASFLDRMTMLKLQKPGEDLLGLFQDGKILLREDDGSVGSKVVRHEIFHAIYNDYLTPKERQRVSEAFDPLGKMTPQNLEEALADHFMNWQRTPETYGSRIRQLFNKVLSWIGFAKDNAGTISDLFKKIEDGKFQVKSPETSNTRMAFSDIKKYGTIQEYKNASQKVQGIIYRNYVNDSLENMPLTQKELLPVIHEELKNEFNTISKDLDALVEAQQESLRSYELETDPELKAEHSSDVDFISEEIAALNQQYATLNRFMGDDGYSTLKDLWKDLYPNFKTKADLDKFEEDEQYNDPESIERAESEELDKASTGLTDFTVQSDERNNETRISENVKNFLSFVYRPKTVGKNGQEASRVNPRFVYLQSLKTLAGLSSSDPDFTDQIKGRAADMGINLSGRSDAALVVNHILNTIENAKGSSYSFRTGQTDEQGRYRSQEIELPGHNRFLDENTFVTSTENQDLTHSTATGVLADARNFVIKREGKSTTEFLQQVADIVGMDQAKGYFRQLQAQESVRELMSTFLSQRESTPMIAEEVRGFKTTLKYFRAQNYGTERIKTVEVENAFKQNYSKLGQEDWARFNSLSAERGIGKAKALAFLAERMGIKGHTSIPPVDNGLVNAVHGDLEALEASIKQAESEPRPQRDDSDESTPEDFNPVAAALENNTGLLDRFTRLLTLHSAEQRASSYMDVSGTKRYLFHNGSQAHDTIGKIIGYFEKSNTKLRSLPEHFKDPVLAKNIFAGSDINRIYELLDHDGQRQEGKEEFAVTYSKETNTQWLKRNFSDAFLSFMKTNSGNNDAALTYMQNFYTISNRPRMLGASVRVLPEAKIKEALIKGIEQHLEQPDRTDIKNYDRFKAVNFDEMHRAIEELHKDKLEGKPVSEHRNSPEGRAKLGRIYQEISESSELKSQVAGHMIGQLKAHAEEVMETLRREKVPLGSGMHETMRLMKDPRKAILPADAQVLETEINEKENYPSNEDLRATVESFCLNNYVNSFFLNQAVAGNMNYFKDSADLIKRMSGVFAPGIKGMVSSRFFMPEKFRVAISNDIKLQGNLLSDIFNDTQLKATLKKEGFDLTDAQGYMLPERADQIVQGFGQAYNSGAVFKPAHYEVADRGDGNYVPTMLKYSSVVLSDDLVSRFPKLEALRDAMRNHPDGPVHEFVFSTGDKVGTPKELVTLPTDEGAVKIPSESVLSLSNDNYRLQLNPNHDAYDKVANPTQLGYFLNVMHKLTDAGAPNIEAANQVYSAIAEKVTRGIARLSQNSLDKQGKFTAGSIIRTLSGVGNERIQEMLKSGINYNFPNIADKALIQMANITSKGTVKIKFPGGKMVLQSSYGADIPSEIPKGQEEFWSRYGQNVSSSLDHPRRLEYKQDPATGRWHAEVILPKIYADKANPGDFLTGDMMGFRIPSTELHSSVPLKIAGFYDDKGSNVVIAPAELVAQHGSDFDVDSLYTISREQSSKRLWRQDGTEVIDKGHPVGYYREADGSLKFNPDRFRAELDRHRIEYAGDKGVLADVEKLHDQLLNNIVTESFLDTISHESNRQRMLTPISTDVIDNSFKELGIKPELNLNTSRILDNMKMFNSNFQGASLVGVFANGMKALSYMSRAGKSEAGDEYPQLQGENPGITLGDKTYDKFTELDHTGGNMWSELDALVNTSVDNVKDQKLYLMNATDRTGGVYIAAKAIGMPLTDAMRLMLQPVIKWYSTIDGGRSTVLNNLKAEMAEHAVKLGLLENAKYSDIEMELQGRELPKAESLSPKVLDKYLKANSFGETIEEFNHQFHVLKQFERLVKIGDDITDFSRAISIVQDMPVFYQDIATKQDTWNKIGTVTDGKFYTSDQFSFNLDRLFEAQPNIAAAYDTFQWMKKGIDTSLIKHFPEVQSLAKQLDRSMKIKLAGDQNKNIELLKNEVMSYLVSSYYSSELQDQEPVTVSGKKSKNERVVTGKVAWGQQFADRISQVLAEDKKLADNDQNPFLKRIAVKDRGYGIKTLEFANTSNPTAEESVEMQDGFSAIRDESLKQDLVKYAALNYGMSFGVRNYSMFIPSEYLRPLSDFINRDLRDKVQASKLDEEGTLISGPLKHLADNLAIKLAVNNIDRLPYISSKKIQPIHTLDEDGQPKYTSIGNEAVAVHSGYDGEYYWNQAYENPVVKENGDRKYSEDDLPQFIRRREGGIERGRDVAYIRVNDVDSDKIYYQKLGYKNFAGGYDGADRAIDGNYAIEDYFGKGTIPVPVADIRTGKYETYNEHIKPGQHVIVYPYSNETREQGISGIVDKVTEGLVDKTKKSFTLVPNTVDKPNTPDEAAAITAIATDVASRFNLDLHIAEGAAGGKKGSIYGDRINLDPRLMTRDTPFHEVAHPLVAAIQQNNPGWYQSLSIELKESPEGRILLRRVQAAYPELTSSAQEREALVTAIGQEAAGKLKEGSFRTLVRRLMRSVGNLVRQVLTKLKGGEPLTIKDLANEDMVKLRIGDIADILANTKVKLDLSGIQDDVQYSKDLDKPEGIIEKLLSNQDNIKDPEIDINGKQGDTYKVNGDILPRISRVIDNFTFRKKQEYTNPDGSTMSSEDAIAKRDADRMFRNTPPGGKLIIDGVEMDKVTYQEQKKKLQLQGQLKGDIIHAQLQQFFTMDPATKLELTKKIETLAAQSETRADAYNWITDKKVLSKVLDNAGIHVGDQVPENQRDRIYSEIKVASPEIGAGKIDQLIVRPDNRLKIVDWKTGARLKDKYTSNIMKYGLQEHQITDNPLDRAKLQVTLYALMVKAEHPEAKFDGLTVMHIPNEYEATQGRNALNVETSDYLRMIEQYYRNEEPAKYKALLAKSPKLFDPREYNAPRDADYTQDVLNSNGASEAETMQSLRLQLQKLVTTVELRKAEDSSEEWTREERLTRDRLMKKILQGSSLIPVDFSGELDSKYEISTMTRYLANLNDTHNPYIQSYASMLNAGKEAARAEFDTKQREFKRLLGAVLKEKGMNQNLLERSVAWVNKEKVFQNLWNEKETIDPDTGTKYLERGLTVKGDEKYNKLSTAEKALSDYMAKEMKDIFHEVMIMGKNAIVGEDSRGKPMTKLDLYNKSRRGAAFEYKDNFVPRVAITHEEVLQRATRNGLSGIAAYGKDFFLRHATDFFENNIEGYNQKDYGLPVRFLGNANTYASPDSYSMDLQLAFEKYMEQMINKKHLDHSWVAGQALKGYLETRNDMNGNPAFKNAAGFLDFQINNVLIGDRLLRGSGKLTRQGMAVYRKDGENYNISPVKIYRSLKSGFAASTLWLQPARSLKNAIQLEYMQGKEELVNGILRGIKGTNTKELDLSPKSMVANYKEAMGSQFTQLTGNTDTDFIHQLAKKLRLYPAMNEMGISPSDSMTRGARLLSTHNFAYLYQMPEEVVNVQYALSFLKNLKVEGGKYAGKSMYEMYKNSFDKTTGEFKLPADFTRGKIQLPDGTFDTLSGLHPMEVQKIHRGIAKLQGGYRSDEKTAVQATILGDALMMFKRWIPGMLVNQFKSKYEDPSIGQFEKVMDSAGQLKQRDGEDVYEWRARVVEGRAKVMGRLIMNYMGMAKNSGYNWGDLSTEQRKSVIDFSVALGTWASMLTMSAALLGKRNEKDTLKEFTTEMTGRLFEQWAVPVMADSALQPPAVVKKSLEIGKGFYALLAGGINEAVGGPDEQTYTNKGDRKGASLIEKNLPFSSSLYEINKDRENADKDTFWDEVNPF